MFSNTLGVSDNKQMALAYFRAADIDLNPPKMLFFNDQQGELLVKARASDLTAIEHLVAALNWTPAQVMLETKLVYLTREECTMLGLSSRTNTAPLYVPDPGRLSGRPGVVPPGFGEEKFVLSETEFRRIIADIEKRTEEDILTVGKVTTESGRQVSMGQGPPDKGPTLDVFPGVFPDGFSIQLEMFATVRPNHEIYAAQNVLDGQTLMCIETGSKKAASKEKLVVFVTPRIIDAAGSFVHTDDEIRERSLRP